MRIQARLSGKADDVSLSGSILTINLKGYDLTKLKEFDVEIEDNGPCYLEGGKEIINLIVDIDRQFMFINGNDKRFYDKDSNNLIDISELKVIIDHWNMKGKDRRAEHKQILFEYLKTHTKEEWLEKGQYRKACGQLK